MDNERLDEDLKNQVNGKDGINIDEHKDNTNSDYEFSREKFDKIFSRFKRKKDSKKPNNEEWMDRTVKAGKVPVGSIYTETDYSIKSNDPLEYITDMLLSIILAPFRLAKELSIKCIFLGKTELLTTFKWSAILSLIVLLGELIYQIYNKLPMNIDRNINGVGVPLVALIVIGISYGFIKASDSVVLTHEVDLADTTMRSSMSSKLKENMTNSTDKEIKVDRALTYEEFKKSAEAELASGKLTDSQIQTVFESNPNEIFSSVDELSASNNIRAGFNDSVNLSKGEDSTFSTDIFEGDSLGSSFDDDGDWF